MQTPQRIFLTTKDLQILHGCSYITAYRLYKTVLSSIGKPENKKLTVQEYCTVEMVCPSEVKSALNIR